MTETDITNWNQQWPVGTPVKLEIPGQPATVAKTFARAFLLGGHTPIVWVEGFTAAVPLDQVTPIPENDRPAAPGTLL